MDNFLNIEKGKLYSSPRPVSRVHGNTARGIEKKHKSGIMSKVMNVEENRFYYSPRNGKTRPDGQEYRDRDFHGKDIKNIMNAEDNKGYYTDRPNPKVKGKGMDIASKSINGTMGGILNADANRGYYSARGVPRVKAEASDTYEQHQGSMTKFLNDSANRNYYSPRPGPRVKSEASDNANVGRGTMDVVLGSAEAPPASPGCGVPRVKPEASENATKAKGVLMQQQYNFGNLPLSDRPASRVKGDGAGNYEASQGNITKNLFHRYGDLPQSARPAARVRPEARAFAAKCNGSTISQLMYGPKQTYKSHVSGRASAMW